MSAGAGALKRHAAQYAAAYLFPRWLIRQPTRRRAGIMAGIENVPGSELDSLRRAYSRAEESGDEETMRWLDEGMKKSRAPEDWRTA